MSAVYLSPRFAALLAQLLDDPDADVEPTVTFHRLDESGADATATPDPAAPPGR